MSFQFSTGVRNAVLDQIETTIGTAAVLRIFTGSEPANCGTADSGTKLLESTLPSDWMNNASGGTKTLLGTWSSTGLAAGNAGYFRIYDSGITTCHIQGNITATGGGGDMTLDNINIAVSQTVSVTSFTLTAPNS